ncbi:MAG TPA: amidohydrolase family protein [Terracidiphilus sp.]|nr:amidohydrolase family protein [Terracidiphilus sp.]
MRVDAHQHFWRYSAAEYGWIDDAMAALKRDFLPADLKPLLAANGFDASIAVQARQTLEETEDLLELAEVNDFIAAVVGWVNLCAPAVRGDLERLSARKKLKGVRHVVQAEPDREFLLRADFQRGMGLLKEFDLTYDVLIYPKHLAVTEQFVRAFPEQRFVLDHMAKPVIAAGLLEPWKADMRVLGRHSNVTCKLSGMVTEARWGQWTQRDFEPYLDTVLETFGPERLMIGSDWPVCTVSADYAAAMGIVRTHIARLTETERAAIEGGTCARVYGIDG